MKKTLKYEAIWLSRKSILLTAEEALLEEVLCYIIPTYLIKSTMQRLGGLIKKHYHVSVE